MSYQNVVPHMRAAVAAYMRDNSPYDQARSAIRTRLPDFNDAIARKVLDECGDIPAAQSAEQQEQRRRLVYAQLIIAAERDARRSAGRPMQIQEIEKLLRLMCWVSDTARELARPRPPAAAPEAEAA